MDQNNIIKPEPYITNNSFNQSLPLVNQKKSNSKRKKIFRIGIIILIVGFFLFLGKNYLKNLIIHKKSAVSQQTKETSQAKSQTIKIEKEFTFPGLDENGKKKGKLVLRITETEKTNQVIVQDKTYTAKNGKTFLIINLELENQTTNRLNIFPGDLMRLVVNDQEEKKFAPDLHNNYVLVAPISTKIERVGFVIDENVSDLKLQVGELEEDKETIALKF